MANQQQPFNSSASHHVPAIQTPDAAVAGGYNAAGVQLGKTRGPFAVWLLTVVTFGIYALVWYFKVNRELRDYNGQINVSPGLALCNITIIGAVTLGIAGVVSFIRTGGRITQAMVHARVGTCSGLVGILLQVVLFGTGVCYYQAHLNRVWAAHGQS